MPVPLNSVPREFCWSAPAHCTDSNRLVRQKIEFQPLNYEIVLKRFKPFLNDCPLWAPGKCYWTPIACTGTE